MRTPSIQVLILEQCELTDASSQHLTGIIKAQESAMDTLFWNVTLRIQPPNALEANKVAAAAAAAPPTRASGPWMKYVKSKFDHKLTAVNVDHSTYLEEDIFRVPAETVGAGVDIDSNGDDDNNDVDNNGSDADDGSLSPIDSGSDKDNGNNRNKNEGAWETWIPKDDENLQREVEKMYSGGLVAVSINGNYFSDEGVELLFRNLKHNHWLLGLNLANNNISKDCVKNHLMPSLFANNVLHTLVIAGNPGYTPALALKMKHFTDNCECRFDVLEPEALQRVLYRWSLLQEQEAYGAGVSVTLKQVTTQAELTSTSAWRNAATTSAVGATAAWKRGRVGDSVDSSSANASSLCKAAVYDRRTYAIEPRPRWTCNAKGLKPPTILTGGKPVNKQQPKQDNVCSSSVTHKTLLSASLKRVNGAATGAANTHENKKTKIKIARKKSSHSLDAGAVDAYSSDDDYWRCQRFAEFSVASSLQEEASSTGNGGHGGNRGPSRYQQSYDHAESYSHVHSGHYDHYSHADVIREIEHQQQLDAQEREQEREDVLAGALPSGSGEFFPDGDSPTHWAGDQLYSPTRMFAADAILGLKSTTVSDSDAGTARPKSRGSIRAYSSPSGASYGESLGQGQFVEGTSGRAVTAVGRMRERPSASSSPVHRVHVSRRKSESSIHGRLTAQTRQSPPTRSMSASMAQPSVVSMRQSMPAARSVSASAVASSSSLRRSLPVSSSSSFSATKSVGPKSMTVGFGRHSSSTPFLHNSHAAPASAPVSVQTRTQVMKLKKRRTAMDKHATGSVSVDILGGGGDKPTRMRARQQGHVSHDAKSTSVRNPYLAANEETMAMMFSPAPSTRAGMRSPSPNVIGSGAKVSPALSAVSGLTMGSVASKGTRGSVGATSAASESTASSNSKRSKKKGAGKKKPKMKSITSKRTEDLFSPATKALERKLGSAVEMLTKHVASVSKQLHVASDIIFEQVTQGVDAIQRSAEKARANIDGGTSISSSGSNSSRQGSPFSLLQSSVNSHGSPGATTAVVSQQRSQQQFSAPQSKMNGTAASLGSPAGTVGGSPSTNKPNVFANLTVEEEVELRELIQTSLRERISTVYHNA